ncbi:MAG: AsmA-like C-terminal region-containing protein [Candidatus Omnitrophica bacterium]|nr:AsmA-like C-terminal region-containing protein [Candidatus Omnitrophota bacterium]
MNRYIKIAAAIFFSLFILFVVISGAVYVFIRNFDIARYRPQIIKMAGEALNRTVDFKDIELKISWARGLRLRLNDFAVGDDPAFGTGDFIFAKEINAGVDLISSIKKRNIAASDIAVSSLTVNIIRDKNGLLNVQTIGNKAADASVLPASHKFSGSSKPALAAFFIHSIKVFDAAVYFSDNSASPAADISVSKINLEVGGFSLSRPFDILLNAAVLSSEANLYLQGRVDPDMLKNQARLNGIKVSIDLGQISLEKLKNFPSLKDMPLPDSLNGELKILVKNAVLSDKGIGDIDMDLSLADGGISITRPSSGMRIMSKKINADAKNISFNRPFDFNISFAYEGNETNISLNGSLLMDAANKSIRMNQAALWADLSKISLERIKTLPVLSKTTHFPDALSGQLSARVKDMLLTNEGLKALNADISLKNGAVSMKEIAPGISFTASLIDCEIKDLKLDSMFDFNIGLAYLSSSPNIKIKGRSGFFLQGQDIRFENTTIEADLSAFSIDRLKASAPVFKNARLPESVRGNFYALVKDMSAGAKGLNRLVSHGQLKEGEVKFKELLLPIKNIDAEFDLTENDFTMDSAQAAIGKGKAFMGFKMQDYAGAKNFAFSARLDGIDLSEALDQSRFGVRVEGLVNGNIRINGRGEDLSSFTGNGKLEAKEAKLVDLNVLKTVLDKMSFLPNAYSQIADNLPERYKAILQDKDTQINKASAELKISDGLILFDPVLIEAEEFIFSGMIRSGFDQKYSLEGKVVVPNELSGAMTQSAPLMQYLLNQDGNISIPVYVTGQGAAKPVISVTQTAFDIGKNALLLEGKRQLAKALNKTLGIEDSSSENTDADADTESQNDAAIQEDTVDTYQIVSSIFSKVFEKSDEE